MKVWIKLLLGTLAGVVLGLLFPTPVHNEPSLLEFLSDIILGLGRYALFPFVFFSTAIAINDLRHDKKLAQVVLRGLIYMALFTLILVIIGTLLILIFNPQRIPITTKKESELIFQSWHETFQHLIPQNSFQILTGGADFLLPVYLFSFLLGLHFNFDKDATQPTINVFDSLSKIFYHLNSFFIELFGFAIVVLSGAYFVQLRVIQDWQLYLQLVVVLFLAAAIVLFAVIPLLLYFFAGKENPYKWIFGLMGAGLGAFFSGDSFFSLGLVSRFSRENLGVPRKTGAVNLPLFAMFARAGTAMTTAIAFFIILKSYSSLEITYDQVLWTVLFSFLLSFTLPSVPTLGAYVSLYLLCSLYGKGLENGYLNLQPIVPILVSFSTLLDVYAAGLCAFLVSRHEGMQKQIKSKLYI